MTNRQTAHTTAINDNRQIVTNATDIPTSQTGPLLLTPGWPSRPERWLIPGSN